MWPVTPIRSAPMIARITGGCQSVRWATPWSLKVANGSVTYIQDENNGEQRLACASLLLAQTGCVKILRGAIFHACDIVSSHRTSSTFIAMHIPLIELIFVGVFALLPEDMFAQLAFQLLFLYNTTATFNNLRCVKFVSLNISRIQQQCLDLWEQFCA